jgi:hypothetical protein
MLMLAAPVARAADPYPLVGVYSVLGAEAEKHYGMDKFTCLASFAVQRADGSYTAYHIDETKLGKDFKVEFHPYDMGTCSYDAGKKLETCKVTKSNWGEHVYYIIHRGTIDGAEVQDAADAANPTAVSTANLRKCPFDEAQIKPFLSEQWLNYNDEDFGWTVYRYLPFNPDVAPKIAKAIGVSGQ